MGKTVQSPRQGLAQRLCSKWVFWINGGPESRAEAGLEEEMKGEKAAESTAVTPRSGGPELRPRRT